MRFDGYTSRMDILEIPNLRQKSNEILTRMFQNIAWDSIAGQSVLAATKPILVWALYGHIVLLPMGRDVWDHFLFESSSAQAVWPAVARTPPLQLRASPHGIACVFPLLSNSFAHR